MSGCLDRVRCQCDCLEPIKEWMQPKRNMFASIAAGTLVCLLQILHKVLVKVTPSLHSLPLAGGP